MSLKAKIEAIIYASDEPVTLLQLVGVLGQEAQSELDALDGRQATLPLSGLLRGPVDDDNIGEANDQDALNSETLSDSEVDAEAAVASDAPQDAEAVQRLAAETAPFVVDDILAAAARTTHAGESAEDGEIPPEPSRGDASEAPDSSLEDAGFRESGEFVASPAQTPHAELSAETGELAPDAPPTEAEQKRRQKERERRLRDYIRSILDEVVAEYQRNTDRGLEIKEVANGFRFATKPEFHDAVRGFVRSLKPPLKLSIQALETLAVVAYRQPVTAPEVSEIRGVDSGGVLGSLLTRKLVTTAGRKQVIGRPILYKTTKEFLLRFGLKDLTELPSIEEFDRIAGELNEAIQEEMPMEPSQSSSSPALNEQNAPTQTPGSRREGVELDPGEAGRAATDLEGAGEPGYGHDVHGSQADGTPIDGLEPEDDARESS